MASPAVEAHSQQEDMQAAPHSPQSGDEEGHSQREEEDTQEDNRRSNSNEEASTSAPYPKYLSPTHVLPKQPLQEYTHAGQEAVAFAFTPASSTGIRSLPDAMSNDFRLRLYEQLVASHQAEREARRLATMNTSNSGTKGTAKSHQQERAHSPTSAAKGKSLLTGHKPVTRIHPHSGVFSSIEYVPSEYGRREVINKFERLRSKVAQVHPNDFVVANPPQGPKGTPSFSVYESTREPFVPQYEMECADQRAIKDGILAGPFITGRRVDKLFLLRSRADECMHALCKLLSTDWPTAFLQVFEDVSGGIVVSFDASRAVAEGDLSTYMQNFARNNSVVSEYHLQKDGTQWGVVDEETQSVFYLVWPPWVRHRQGPHRRCAKKAAPTTVNDITLCVECVRTV